METKNKPLSKDLLQKINAYWRAANYLSVGQIYLYDNPLLKKTIEDGTCETTSSWALGHNTRTELHLCAFEPNHKEI